MLIDVLAQGAIWLFTYVPGFNLLFAALAYLATTPVML